MREEREGGKDEGIVDERKAKDEDGSRVNERWAGKTKHKITRTIYLVGYKNLQTI